MVADIFASEPNVVIAKVDADKHKDLAQEYGVSGFPTLKYFSAGDEKEAIPYESDREVEAIVNFINTNAGTFRSPHGGLNPQAGLLSAFSGLVDKYPDITASDVKEAKSIAATLTKDERQYADIYVKVLEKMESKGASYASNELARLTRMMVGGGVTPVKKDAFQLKMNILSEFLAHDEKENEL